MIDARLPLQRAIVAAVGADEILRGLIDSRIYDRVPENRAFPYVSFGPGDAVDDSDQCHDGAETYVQLDIWSRAVGRVEALTIAARLALVLDADLALEGHQVVVHELAALRDMQDPDGKTTHAVVTLRYQTAPSA